MTAMNDKQRLQQLAIERDMSATDDMRRLQQQANVLKVRALANDNSHCGQTVLITGANR